MQNLCRILAAHKSFKGLSFIPRFHIASQKEPQLCLPFQLSVDESYAKFRSDIKFYEVTPQIFKSRKLKIEERGIKTRYLPFYGLEAYDLSSSFEGRYGIDRRVKEMETYYDETSKSTKTREVQKIVTHWYPMSGTLSKTDYPMENPETQVYAGLTYPREIIEKALACKEVQNLEIMNEEKVLPDTVEPHDMNIGHGLEKVHQRLCDLEVEKIKEFCAKKYNTSKIKINFLDVHTNLARIEYKQFYLPAFIYESDLQDDAYLKVMNGYSGEITGDRTLNVPMVGVFSAITGSVFSQGLYLGNAHSNYQVVFPFELCMVGILGASTFFAAAILFVNMLPSIQKEFYADDRAKDISKNRRFLEKENNPALKGVIENLNKERQMINENIKPNEFGMKEESNKRKEESNGKTATSGVAGSNAEKNQTPARNEKTAEKCKLLGLDPESNFSLAELGGAYNIQISKWHPEVFKGDEKIAAAMTQQLHIAFEFLKTEILNEKL